jgi:8-oxo-dGTP diphosphatase
MTEPSPAAHGADNRRHRLIADVHLLLINPMGEVLFGQRQDASFRDGAWNLPSGHLEAGESVMAALIREARKAIGVVIDEYEATFCHVMHNSSDGGRLAFFFAVPRWTGEPTNLEPDKCSDLRWFPLSALPYDLIPYSRTALEWIAVNHYFSTYGW